MTVAHTTRLLVILTCLCGAAEWSIAAQQQPDSDGTSLGIATSQAGAPVGLRGYLAGAGTFLYDTAKVENLSDRLISALTFGVIVADPSNLKSRTVLRSASVGVSLPPGRKQDVNVGLLPVSQLDDLKRSLSRTPNLTLGILGVEWADGTRWVFFLPDADVDFSTGAGRIVPMDMPVERKQVLIPP